MSFIYCIYQLFSCLEAKINISDRSNRVSAFDIFFFYVEKPKTYPSAPRIRIFVCRRVLWFYFAHYCPLCLVLLKLLKSPAMEPNDCLPSSVSFLFSALSQHHLLLQIRTAENPLVYPRGLFVLCRCQPRRAGQVMSIEQRTFTQNRWFIVGLKS